MTSLRTLLLAGAAASLLALPATAASTGTLPLLLAQAGEAGGDAAAAPAVNPLTAAETAVEDARTALRAAIASGAGIDEARQALRAALRALEDARLQAGLPPTENLQDLEPILPEEAAAPPVDAAPVIEETQPAAEEPPAVEPPAVEPPVMEPPVDQVPAEEPPAVEPPPADQPAVEQPPVDQPPVEEPPQPDDGVAPPPPPAPPVTAEEPPPPPPPAATAPTFDLSKFKNRPNFGEAPVDVAPQALPPSAETVKEGAAIVAPDGRIIVKEDGQISVNHDDTGRFRQIGGDVATTDSGNGMTTTTITRPDGTEVVTVRDSSGNIIQRYRKNRDGNIEMLIGEGQAPSLVDRVLGRTPPPVDAPPVLDLQLGPLQLSIPEDQYAVESSRATPQLLQKTLIAPPVEAVERPYTLEEIRRFGRLRDKVRRIDFDTITFDTGKATVADDQIQRMQNIGLALRAVIQRDPTQVFLVEGHADAVGADLYNLALSDRRAETVAEILAYYFGIPPENLITQGYGEQFLKIPTVAAERQNRRVAFRNITYLLRGADAQ